jgi:hypothetical protein
MDLVRVPSGKNQLEFRSTVVYISLGFGSIESHSGVICLSLTLYDCVPKIFFSKKTTTGSNEQ